MMRQKRVESRKYLSRSELSVPVMPVEETLRRKFKALTTINDLVPRTSIGSRCQRGQAVARRTGSAHLAAEVRVGTPSFA
jgi:hypothetical protein